jgi:hypothetical protein
MSTSASTASGHLPSGQFFPAVWKLLRLRWRININSFKHAKTRSKIGIIIGFIAFLAFAGFIFWLSWMLLNILHSPQLVQYIGIDPTPFLDAMPVLIFTGLFLGILLTSFGVLLQALYLSGDMDFLLTSPVPIRAVFVTKLLQAVLPNFSLIALFGLPVLYGLGVSGGYNFLYYPLVLLTMIALTLVAAALSALLVMMVVRLFPARRVAEVLGFLVAILMITFSQIGNLFNFSQSNNDISNAQVSGVFTLLMRLNTQWLPLSWAGRGLVDLGEGRLLSGVLLVTLTLGLSAVTFWFALATAERWYYSGWAGMQVIAQKKKPARALRPVSVSRISAAFWPDRFLPAPVRGIVQKDYLMLRRDLRHLSQLVTPVIFGIIYTLMFLRNGGEPPAGQGEAPDWFMDSFRSILAYGNVLLSLFVGWMLLGRLAGMGFSQEGKNYWMLKESPVRAGHLLAAKFLVAYIPALALGWFFLIGISILQGIPPVDFLYSLLVVAMCMAGMTGILLSFGVAGANFNWEDPRKMTSGKMGCLGALMVVLFLPVAFGMFMGPLWITTAFHQLPVFGYLAGMILGVGICGTCVFLPLRQARRMLARLGEE